ncbi:MAG: hypothetical protein ACOYEV_09675 [Candidatus Nanopelagicales bacterium]
MPTVLPIQPQVALALSAAVGSPLAGSTVVVQGSGLAPNTAVQVEIHSDPVVLGSVQVSASGEFNSTMDVPAKFPPGAHNLIATGTAVGGALVTQSVPFALDENLRVAAIGPGSEALGAQIALQVETARRAASADPSSLLPIYFPLTEPQNVLWLGVAAMALLALLRGGRILRMPNGALASAPVAGEAASALRLRNFQTKKSGIAWGDASSTWRLRGFRQLNRASRLWPPRTAPVSPLLGRILADGTALRAIIGTLWYLVPLFAVLLAGLAAGANAGSSLPPPFVLLVAIMVLGIMDSCAGLTAFVVYALAVAVMGGLATLSSVRILLSVATLWIAVPLIAGAARPLRRDPWSTREERFDRITDYVVATFVSAWAASWLVGTWNGLSGLTLPVAEQTLAVAFVAAAGILLRLGLESVAALYYPQRLGGVSPVSMPEPGTAQRVASVVLRAVLFLFMAVVFVGNSWQLWVGGLLFVVPLLLVAYADRLPSFPQLHLYLPTGIARVVLMLFAGAIAVALVTALLVQPQYQIKYGFVLLSLPGVVLALWEILGREGKPPELTWTRRYVDVALLVIGIWLVLSA